MLFVNQETLLRLESVTGVACSFYCCATTARCSDPRTIYNPPTTAMITVLVMLSLVLTASVVDTDLGAGTILGVLGVGTGLALVAGLAVLAFRRPRAGPPENARHHDWRMPPLDELPRPNLGPGRRAGLIALRGYLIIAVAVVVARLAQLAPTS